jgi:hypothetical protein
MEEKYNIEVYYTPTEQMFKCKIGNRTIHTADIQNILDFISEKKTTPNDDAVMGFYEDNSNGKD